MRHIAQQPLLRTEQRVDALGHLIEVARERRRLIVQLAQLRRDAHRQIAFGEAARGAPDLEQPPRGLPCQAVADQARHDQDHEQAKRQRVGPDVTEHGRRPRQLFHDSHLGEGTRVTLHLPVA